MADAHCAHRFVDRVTFAPVNCCPKTERLVERQARIKRVRLIGECNCALMRDPSRIRFEQPGNHTKQARFASPVRAAHKRCIAGAKRAVNILEQQPPTADTGDIFKDELTAEHSLCDIGILVKRGKARDRTIKR